MKTVYTTITRKNRDNRQCIAPFINDYNIWDIPEKEYTPDVEEAIKNAYELGVKHARDALQKSFTYLKWGKS